MKKMLAIFCISSCFFVLLGCVAKQEYPFSYVGERNGQSIYLDGQKGKVIYVDETNRVIDYVELRPDSFDILQIENNKMAALQNTDRGERIIPGTNYSVSLSTRYYSNRLLYMIELSPYDDGAWRIAETISIELSDSSGFLLGEIESSRNWISTVNNSGEPVLLNTQGSIPITLRNYLEIVMWRIRWRN